MELIDATQRKISINNQQIITNNRELIKKHNAKVFDQLFDQLLQQF